jgi:hypothetical protein
VSKNSQLPQQKRIPLSRMNYNKHGAFITVSVKITHIFFGSILRGLDQRQFTLQPELVRALAADAFYVILFLMFRKNFKKTTKAYSH